MLLHIGNALATPNLSLAAKRGLNRQFDCDPLGGGRALTREITAEQFVRVLVDINRLISLGTSHVEQARTNPRDRNSPWSKENQQKWAEEFPRLHDMAAAGNFSKVFDALHEALEPYRNDSK
jgi:hypothetical protein